MMTLEDKASFVGVIRDLDVKLDRCIVSDRCEVMGPFSFVLSQILVLRAKSGAKALILRAEGGLKSNDKAHETNDKAHKHEIVVSRQRFQLG